MQDLAVHPAIQHHWHDLRANDRYSRYGFLSLLMATCILIRYQGPAPHLDLLTLVQQCVHPAMVALNAAVLVGGFGLAIMLGIAGVLRREWLSKISGVVGAIVAAGFLFEFRTVIS